MQLARYNVAVDKVVVLAAVDVAEDMDEEADVNKEAVVAAVAA